VSFDQLLDEALREADHGRSVPLSSRELEVAELVAMGLTTARALELGNDNRARG
jgi:DNA-binding NarL/FixJ family response regulator